MPELRVAVLSDLHCHTRDLKPAASFLKVGAPRTPIFHHPFEAFLNLVRTDGLVADILVIGGDLANAASPEGLHHGWELGLEAQRALGASVILPVLGNHDVQSRDASVDSFELPKRLRPGFPFGTQAQCDKYFASGYCIESVRGDVQCVLINSVYGHHNEQEAKRGTFPADRIEALSRELASLPPVSHRFAVLHHHPMLHSSPYLADSDIMLTGDALIEALRRHGCTFVVHGHKHHPRISYCNSPAGMSTIFGAGSFSALLQELYTNTKNVFHMITFNSSEDGEDVARGLLRTWEWQMGIGWKPSTIDGAGFPPVVGFGASLEVSVVVDRLSAIAQEFPSDATISDDVVAKAVPDLLYCIPSLINQVNETLSGRHSLLLLPLDPPESGYYLGRKYRRGGRQ